MKLKESDFPLMDKKVKVTNPNYRDGGYIGKVIGISKFGLIVEILLHLDGTNPIANSDGWEDFERCEII